MMMDAASAAAADDDDGGGGGDGGGDDELKYKYFQNHPIRNGQADTHCPIYFINDNWDNHLILDTPYRIYLKRIFNIKCLPTSLHNDFLQLI